MVPLTQRTAVHYIFGLWDVQRQLPPFMRQLVSHNKHVLSRDEFETVIWYREEIERLFEEAGYKELWEYLHIHVPRKVVLADLARYMVLWQRGGLYLDLDVRVNYNLKPIIRQPGDVPPTTAERASSSYTCDVLLFTEHDRCDPRWMGPLEDRTQTRRMYNCMMFCDPDDKKPGRAFFRQCFELGVERVKRMIHIRNNNVSTEASLLPDHVGSSTSVVWSDTDVLWASGPDVVTSVYHEISLREAQHSARTYHINTIPHEHSVALLTHLQAGTWKRQQDR